MLLSPLTAEARRLEALANYDILDTLPDADYDAITRIAAPICQTPISRIAWIDEQRQRSESTPGLAMGQTPRNVYVHLGILKKQVVGFSDLLSNVLSIGKIEAGRISHSAQPSGLNYCTAFYGASRGAVRSGRAKNTLEQPVRFSCSPDTPTN